MLLLDFLQAFRVDLGSRLDLWSIDIAAILFRDNLATFFRLLFLIIIIGGCCQWRWWRNEQFLRGYIQWNEAPIIDLLLRLAVTIEGNLPRTFPKGLLSLLLLLLLIPIPPSSIIMSESSMVTHCNNTNPLPFVPHPLANPINRHMTLTQFWSLLAMQHGRSEWPVRSKPRSLKWQCHRRRRTVPRSESLLVALRRSWERKEEAEEGGRRKRWMVRMELWIVDRWWIHRSIQ